jgi:protein-tyrosine phosphatase
VVLPRGRVGEDGQMPFRVCLVCMGNICRSPMAEAVLRHQLDEAGLGGEVAVESAGTGSWHVGEGADRRAMRALREGGYDLQHRARQFEPDWFNRYDLVIALDRMNLADLQEMAPDESTAKSLRLLRSYDPALEGAYEDDLDVPDPYYGGGDGFARVLAMVESACRGLVDEIRREVDRP